MRCCAPKLFLQSTQLSHHSVKNNYYQVCKRFMQFIAHLTDSFQPYQGRFLIVHDQLVFLITLLSCSTSASTTSESKQLALPNKVIKNIRNVTRHRNGQSVKSRQTSWEWQLLISIMDIHDVVTHYNNCAFLCACHVNITVFFALPPCCVVESYSRVCVLVDDHAIFYFNHRRDKVILHFCFRQCVSQCH